jgi:fucose permease
MVAEGAMADWSAVYLRDALGADAGLAAAGYAAFSLTMAAGRFAGDALRARVSAARLVRLGGGTAALGLGAALLVGHPSAALIGFGCVGLGLSNVVPVLFSAAGRAPGVPTGTAIAAVASAGYAGFLAGPPVIGFVAQATTLTAGLGLVVLCLAAVAVGAGSAGR